MRVTKPKPGTVVFFGDTHHRRVVHGEIRIYPDMERLSVISDESESYNFPLRMCYIMWGEKKAKVRPPVV
jgi:hypothetical protein